MHDHQIDPVKPNEYAVAAYSVFLSRRFKAPTTVANFMSGASTWVTMSGGSSDIFKGALVKLTKRGINKLSKHKASQAIPITSEDIMMIVDYLASTGPASDVIAAAFLVGYFTLVRQSNLLTPALDLWGGAHTMRRGDIYCSRNKIESKG